ncbi:MAG: DNA-binding protein [Bacteroidales bacterium]|jgi:hypothetical protein|nr:DNA-binding protein [Bacteroidales bacterium]
MSKKKSFVLRLNEDKMKALEKWAADEFRSANGQIEWIITKALKDSKRLKKTDLSNTDED